jgi:hypothetical protein
MTVAVGCITEDLWRLAADDHLAAGAGMAEPQLCRVQQVARIAGKGTAVGCRQTAGFVKRVTHQGMACSSQVDANLVGSAGVEGHVAEE